MADDSLKETLVRVRGMLVDLERHVDCASIDDDVGEAARAWVKATQIARLLRSVLPADVTAAEAEDVVEADGDARSG
jgi:hypothetical protein